MQLRKFTKKNKDMKEYRGKVQVEVSIDTIARQLNSFLAVSMSEDHSELLAETIMDERIGTNGLETLFFSINKIPLNPPFEIGDKVYSNALSFENPIGNCTIESIDPENKKVNVRYENDSPFTEPGVRHITAWVDYKTIKSAE
jgi:hypothetical protein